MEPQPPCSTAADWLWGDAAELGEGGLLADGIRVVAGRNLATNLPQGEAALWWAGARPSSWEESGADSRLAAQFAARNVLAASGHLADRRRRGWAPLR